MIHAEATTRERIMKVAFGLFLKDGYETTSVQNIIDAVGIAKGTYYHHFVSKDQMLEELVDTIARESLRQKEEIEKRSDLNAVQKLVLVLRAASDIKLERFEESIVLVKQMMQTANEKIRAYVRRAALKSITPLFAKFLRDGVTEGVLAIEYPEETSELIVAMGQGLSDRTLDVLVAAIDGDDEAFAHMLRLSRSYERAVEGILGLAPGMFSLYDEEQLISLIQTVRQKNLQTQPVSGGTS